MTTLDPILNEVFLAGLNPQQLAAVTQPLNASVQVLAGAGTGKTEVISRRFVKLVQELQAAGVPHAQDRILVVTFTKDAAAGMRSRINKYLLAAGLDPLSSDAWIGTFHQVSLRLLKMHSLHLGFAPALEILEQLSQKLLFTRIINGILAGDYSDLSAMFERQNLQALPPDVLSLASLQQLGLTQLTDIVDDTRLYDIIKRAKSSGWTPAEFYHQSLRQTQQFATDLLNLPTPTLENPPKLVRDAILQRFLLSLDAWQDVLRSRADRHWNPLELDANISKYKEAVGELHYYYLDSKTSVPLDRSELTRYLNETLALETAVLQIVTAVYGLYQDTLQLKNACDFDDQINHTVRLLKENDTLRAHYQKYFKAMIVDEFQDSNGSQLQLLRLLLDPNSPNITVVGDQKQSIYNFRFAQPENLHLIFEGFTPTQTPLVTNYRSYPPILWVSNQLSRMLVNDDQQLAVCEKFVDEHEPKITWLTLGNGNPMDEQKIQEAWIIAIEIARLVTSGQYAFKDIAVLVPSHVKAEAIQTQLAQFEIPALRQKNLGFFEEPVIKDALALLRLMVNLRDDASLVRILQGKLSQADIYALKEKGRSLFEVIQRHPKLNVLAESLLSVKRRQHRLTPVQLFLALSNEVGIIQPQTPDYLKVQQRTALRAFEQLLHDIGHKDLIQPTLGEILKTLEDYAANPDLELPIPSLASDDDEENAVRLMTIHGSKGLEYPVVFVAGVEKPRPGARINDKTLVFEPQFGDRPGFGLLLGRDMLRDTLNPARKKSALKFAVYKTIWADSQAQAEKQRLFYVALTRAREKLFVLRSEKSEPWTACPDGAEAYVDCYSEADTPEYFTQYEDTAAIQACINVLAQRQQKPSLQSAPARIEIPTKVIEPLHLSFSSVKAHQRCPAYFGYRYRWKLPEPPSILQPKASQGVQIGRYVHGLIHKHYLAAGELSESIIDAVLDSWLPQNDEETVAGKLDIKNRYGLFAASEFSYQALTTKHCRVMPEKSIRFPWESPYERPVTVEVDGVLDLLIHDTQKNEYTLIDFKTNKDLSEKHQQGYFLQLRLYRHGLLKLWPEMNLPEANLNLVHLSPTHLETFPYQLSLIDKDWPQLEQQFRATIETCLGDTPPQKSADAPCRTCAYLKFCPQA